MSVLKKRWFSRPGSILKPYDRFLYQALADHVTDQLEESLFVDLIEWKKPLAAQCLECFLCSPVLISCQGPHIKRVGAKFRRWTGNSRCCR